MTTRTQGDALRWTRTGTALLHRALVGLSDSDLRAPTALPGWTRAHLLAHLGGNARALRNLVDWAATGEETPMYGSPEQRTAEIEDGSTRPTRDLLLDFGRSASDLIDGMAALSAEQWQHDVVTAQGRTVLATEIPWLRAREVMVHATDLGTGIRFADLPEDFVAALIEDIAAKRDLTELPAGPSPDVAGWLAGRSHGLAGVPELGAWL